MKLIGCIILVIGVLVTLCLIAYTKFKIEYNKIVLLSPEHKFKGKAEISRDEWGVPHIFAENEEMALFA